MKSGIGSRKAGSKKCSFFNRIFPGIPCFVVGSSPFINDLNLNAIENNLSISINRSMFKFNSIIGMWQDISFWKTEKSTIQTTKCWKVCTPYSDPNNCFYHFSIKGGEFKKTEDCSELFGSGSSGPLAVQFAIAMGCYPIVCIGMDCEIKDGKTDFYGINKFWGPNTIENCKKGIEWIKKEFPDDMVILCDSVKKYNEYADKFCDISKRDILNSTIFDSLKNSKQSR